MGSLAPFLKVNGGRPGAISVGRQAAGEVFYWELRAWDNLKKWTAGQQEERWSRCKSIGTARSFFDVGPWGGKELTFFIDPPGLLSS